MANSSLQLTSLDFDTLKAEFKEFLKTQSVFKDYNFDGSNINVLLDVMSYNTYLNSFYLNMVASEMFLDSAQKYDSVISHAKELNYTPRSAHASVANVSFTVQTSGMTTNRLTIPKDTKFSGYNSNGTYNFVTDQTTTYISSNGFYTIENLQINQGLYFKDSFVMDYDNPDQKMIISNQNIDTNSLLVYVIENSGSSNTIYTKATTLYGLDFSSTVYFLQAVDNQRYELIFGDGVLGKRPLNAATIVAEYIVTEGTDGNGVDNFSMTDDLGINNGGLATTSDITVINSSTSGANQESIESIRFSAPRYFATQQRAVSSDDYSSLVKTRFGGEIEDVIIYGGQELEPKLYGRVIVSIKPASSVYAPQYLKNAVTNYLQDFIALPNRVIVSDPDYFYIKIDTTVQYNSKATTKYASEIQTNIMNTILSFADTNLNKFGNDFRYSRMVTALDNTDSSIISNDTHVKIIKKISPVLSSNTSFDIQFNNVAEQEGVFDGVAYPDERVFTSSSFTYVDADDNEWPFSYLEDDPAYGLTQNTNTGKIKVYTYINGKRYFINEDTGSINYTTGRVILTNFKTSFYLGDISLYLTSLNKDIIATKNMVLLIDANDVTINVIEQLK